MLGAMKTPSSFLLVMVALVVATLAERSLLAGGTGKVAPPKRVKMNCAAYRAGMERSAKSAGIKMTLTPGSWGTIPKALQTLPPGAELCGAVEGATIIVSPLFGKDFETFYAPLFAKAGCQPFTCDVTGGSTSCTCKGSGTRGRIQTDPDVEEFSLHFMGN